MNARDEWRHSIAYIVRENKLIGLRDRDLLLLLLWQLNLNLQAVKLVSDSFLGSVSEAGYLYRVSAINIKICA